MPKHKILVPTDGSDFSRQAYDHIEQFLPPEDNALTLIRVSVSPAGHVGHPSKPAAPDSRVPMYDSRADVIEARHPIYASQEQASAAADLERALMNDARRLAEAGYEVETVIRFNGNAGQAIMKYVDSHDVDMVVMTTRGHSGIERLLHGSTAQYLCRHITQPITMVRPRANRSA